MHATNNDNFGVQQRSSGTLHSTTQPVSSPTRPYLRVHIVHWLNCPLNVCPWCTQYTTEHCSNPTHTRFRPNRNNKFTTYQISFNTLFQPTQWSLKTFDFAQTASFSTPTITIATRKHETSTNLLLETNTRTVRDAAAINLQIIKLWSPHQNSINYLARANDSFTELRYGWYWLAAHNLLFLLSLRQRRGCWCCVVLRQRQRVLAAWKVTFIVFNLFPAYCVVESMPRRRAARQNVNIRIWCDRWAESGWCKWVPNPNERFPCFEAYVSVESWSNCLLFPYYCPQAFVVCVVFVEHLRARWSRWDYLNSLSGKPDFIDSNNSNWVRNSF